MFDIVIRRDDTLPLIKKTLYVNGAPFPLTGYAVKFVVSKIDGTELFNNDAALDPDQDANPGVVTYQWKEADSTEVVDNIAFARFVATKDQDQFTVPNNSPLTIFLTSTTTSEYSYSGNPSARPIDAVRFLLGDVDMTKSLFTDSEIQYLIDTQGSSYSAASEAALAYAARYTDLKDKTVGPLSIRYSQVALQWMNLAQSLRQRGSRNSGALAITTQASTEPAFKRGINDFPESVLFDWQDVQGGPPC